MSHDLLSSLRRHGSTLALTALLALIFTVGGADLAFAEGDTGYTASNQVFATVQAKGVETFTGVRNTAFVLGAFGIVGLGVAAFFGKFNWRWLGALVGGLVLLAVAGAAISYVTGHSKGSTANLTVKDSM